jgi:hypothetical protein
MIWTYEKVHKYSFKIQLIFNFVFMFLWYDIFLISSPKHTSHQLMDYGIVHIEMEVKGAIHKFWIQKLITFIIRKIN